MGADADMRLKRAQASKAQKGKIRRDTRAKEAQLVKHIAQSLRARIQETPEQRACRGWQDAGNTTHSKHQNIESRGWCVQ